MATSIAHAGAQPAVLNRQVWWRRIGTMAGMFLGLVLLVAAWAKAIHPVAFADQIHLEGLDFLFSAPTTAMIALALEIGIGLALLFGLRRPWVMLPALLLVAFFVFLTARGYWRAENGLLPDDASCSCFGNLLERTPAQAFWQDLLLLVPALGLAFVGRPRAPRRLPGIRLSIIALLTLGGLLFAWKAPSLPIDDLATRLKPGVTTASMCAGSEADGSRICLDSILIELDQGEHYVVLADLESESFLEQVSVLNDYALQTPDRPLWVLSASPPEAHQALFWQWAPTFELREVPAPMLAPLYRELPRSFRVLDGRVVETYRGLPPLETSES